MKIVKPLQQGLMTRNFVKDKRFYLSIASLSFFPFQNPTALGTEQEMWEAISNTCDKEAIFDLCIPKARSEVLMVGKCCAPDKTPTQRLFVDLDFGPMIKRVVVTGNRFWVRGDRSENLLGRIVGHDWEMSEPEPFVEMDIGWRNAFGGPDFPENPWGKGYLPSGESPALDHSSPLPNVERPERMMSAPSSVAEPAGYGPIDMTWPQRAEKVGKKYGKKWEKERFPEPAVDMDPTYYNAAPDDQQWVDGFFRGDESFIVTHMHPEYPRQEGALPPIRPRCFVLQRSTDRERWTEVSLYPETVWLFPNVSRGILISRGVFETDTFYGVDVDTLLLAWELKGGLTRPPEAYRKSIVVREDEETSGDWIMREDDLTPPEGIPDEEPIFIDGEEEDPNETFAPIVERANAKANALLDKAKEIAAAVGLDPTQYLSGIDIPPMTLPDAPKLQKMSDLPKILEWADIELQKCDAGANEMMKNSQFLSETKEEAKQKIEAKAREICKTCGQDYDELLARSKMNPPSKEPTFEKCKKLLNDAKSQLAGHPDKVAEIDKALGKVEGAELKLNAMMSAPEMKAADIDTAHYYAPPEKPPQKVLDNLRAWVAQQHENGKGCENADLSYVDLSGMSLPGLNLKGAMLDSANLTETDLSQANLSGTILARAQLNSTKLMDADLEQACLGKAVLDGADLSGAKLNKSVFDQTSCVGAKLIGSELQVDMIYQSQFTEADLSNTVLSEAEIVESNFSKARFIQSDLTKTTFATCELVGVDFSEANLTETAFVEVNATYSKFDRAQMTNTSAHLSSKFCNASFVEVKSEAINFSQTDLTEADFQFASINEADFSESTLFRAKFDRAMARESSFTDADLAEASLLGADLMQASLQNAILRYADFSNAHLFEADLLYADMEFAVFSGAAVKRTLLSNG